MSAPQLLDDARHLRNRQLIAERLGWPDGALDACTALEADYPDWAVFWTDRRPADEPGYREPGYRAVLLMHGWVCKMQTASIGELRARVAEVDERLPRLEFPTPISPLV
jgi:hypothetical protein